MEEERKKTLFEKAVEDEKKDYKKTVKKIKSCKKLFGLVEIMKANYPELRISEYHGRYGRYIFAITANCTGFREVMPLLELLDENGYVCNETHDHPSYSERQFVITETDGMPYIRLNANLVESSQGTCKRVLKQMKSRMETEYEYEFVCEGEEDNYVTPSE